jgi:ABC-2 type transport system ATP-binding protein
LARVGYVAQDHPLYRDFTVADMFHLGRAMNPGWDQQLATGRMETLDIPLNRKVKALSGGQQAQVALTMALAKRAPLLVLDEPVASLDPVARMELMRDVTAVAAGTGLTVVISSHVVAELERFCDWLIILSHGHVQLAGPAGELLAAHRLLTVPRDTPDAELPGTAIHRTDSDRHSTVPVRADLARPATQQLPGWQADPVSFEELVMACLQRPHRRRARRHHLAAAPARPLGRLISRPRRPGHRPPGQRGRQPGQITEYWLP